MSDIARYSVKQTGNIGLGQGGFNTYTDVSLHLGNWLAFKAVNGDAVITSSESATGDNLPASMTLSEGDVVYGDFTAVTLASGTILAYIG